jgi:PhnB protein
VVHEEKTIAVVLVLDDERSGMGEAAGRLLPHERDCAAATRAWHEGAGVSIPGAAVRRTGAGPSDRPAIHSPKGIDMTQAIAYLAFNGNCAEAMRYYERALEGKLEVLMSGAESPIADQIPKESAHRILHARLVLPGGGTLYAGDAPENVPYEGIKGVSITLDYPTTAEAGKVFDALANGGHVIMPMQPAFWAKRWGMLVDRFGTPWIINGEPLAV